MNPFRQVPVILMLLAGPLMAADRPPNVVILFADDLGHGDVGCYGARDIATPNIDALAREGTRFTNFCVAQAVCTASRAALLTGCYPNRIGMAGALNHTSRVGIHANEVLLSELCKQKGYATAVFGKWHLGHQPSFLPTRNGFDTWVGIPYSNDNGPLHPTIRNIPSLPLYENEKIIGQDPDQAQFTRMFTERATAFIRANKERPFFLYVPHVMPHVPIFASEKFKGTSKRGLYGDVVQELDWGIGEVMKALKECGIEEQTLVLFTSDNGPFLSYGDHAGSASPFREGKLTTFEGGVRMPFIARWPGKVPAGRVCNDLITSLDFVPTLVSLIEAVLPRHRLDGQNLLPLLLGERGAKGRETFAYYAGSELQAVRKGDWKLHFPHEYLRVDGTPGTGGKPANFGNAKPTAIEESGIRGIASRHGYRVDKIELSLFDLKNDPGESRNVADRHPAIVKELTELAEQFRDELGDVLTKKTGKNVRPAGKE